MIPQPRGRAQGGMKSAEGRAAYWRINYESAIGALADLIAEHRELAESIETKVAEWRAAIAAVGEPEQDAALVVDDFAALVYSPGVSDPAPGPDVPPST